MPPKLLLVSTVAEGFQKAKETLYAESDKTTALFFSGGKTPKDFYQSLAKDKKLSIGAAGLVDERFGPHLHDDSNERVLQDAGLLSHFKQSSIPFYSVLKDKTTIEQAASDYDEAVRFLLRDFKKSIAIVGVGEDGHTAGIPAQRSTQDLDEKSLFVKAYTNFPGPLKERISLTFAGLSMFDLLLVMVFGKKKKKALNLMFLEGLEEEVPARFFLRDTIASKTLLITDQQV